MKRQILGLMLGVALLGAGYAQAGVIIDNFDTPQAELAQSDPAAAPLTSSVMGDIIFGGKRTLTLDVTANSNSAGSSNESRTSVSGSTYTLSNDSKMKSIGTLAYSLPAGVGVDLNGTPGDEKPWLVFRTTELDQELLVHVELTDTLGVTAINDYVKLPTPQVATNCSAPDHPGGVGSPCPQIVGPIFAVSPNPPDAEGNYYHLLSLFLGGAATDPVTGLPFGAANAINLDSINSIVISFTAPGSSQDLSINCIATVAAPSGVSSAKTGKGEITFPIGGPDGNEPTQCTAVVPEPSTILMLGTGFLGIGLAGLRARVLRRRQQA